MALTPEQEKKSQTILKKIKEYMDIRFAHAVRINPKIKHIYDELAYQQLDSLRMVLADWKAVGPEKFYIVDLLVGDDDAKRKSLFTPTDQNTIMNQILNEKDDEKKAKTAGSLAIKDMRTFYKALDPSLEKIVELVQIWIWWDLPDATDVVHFENQVAAVISLRDKPLSPEVIEFYRKLHKLAAEEVTKEFVIAAEVEKLHHLRKRFKAARDAEEGYQVVLKRDEQPNTSVDGTLVMLAKRIQTVQHVKAAKELEPALKDYYANFFKCAPEAVTKERIVQAEEKLIAETKEKLGKNLEEDKVLGMPYNFKAVQYKKLEETLKKLEDSMPFLKTELEHLHQIEAEEKKQKDQPMY